MTSMRATLATQGRPMMRARPGADGSIEPSDGGSDGSITVADAAFDAGEDADRAMSAPAIVPMASSSNARRTKFASELTGRGTGANFVHPRVSGSTPLTAQGTAEPSAATDRRFFVSAWTTIQSRAFDFGGEETFRTVRPLTLGHFRVMPWTKAANLRGEVCHQDEPAATIRLCGIDAVQSPEDAVSWERHRVLTFAVSLRRTFAETVRSIGWPSDVGPSNFQQDTSPMTEESEFVR